MRKCGERVRKSDENEEEENERQENNDGI